MLTDLNSIKSPTRKGAITRGSGALNDVWPAGRFDDGHNGSEELLGTHIGNPENAVIDLQVGVVSITKSVINDIRSGLPSKVTKSRFSGNVQTKPSLLSVHWLYVRALAVALKKLVPRARLPKHAVGIIDPQGWSIPNFNRGSIGIN